jgi:apolipoprotein D and lipocalin family protein
MHRISALIEANLLSALLLFLFAFGSVAQSKDEPETVERVDLGRYAGLWYEIAKIPNRFQRKCYRDTTANYKLRDDGRISVLNRCIDKEGNSIEASGIAKVMDSDTNAKLKVSFVSLFGIQLFWGDYWIIGLGDDYEYAIVGHPARKYGWILSRGRQLSSEDLEKIKSILRERGYNPDDFAFTLQSKTESKGTRPFN